MSRTQLVLSSLVAAAALAGCSGQVLAPNLLLSLENGPPESGRLSVDFGLVQPHGSYTRWVTVKNEGDASARLVGWSGPDAMEGRPAPPFDADPPLPIEIAPGASETIWIRFDPREETRSWSAVVALEVDGIERTKWPTLQLAGATLPRSCNLSLSATEIDFGIAPPEGKVERVLTFRNESTNPLDVCALSNLRIEAGADPRIGFAEEAPAFVQLAAGEQVTVRFEAESGPPPVPTGSAVFALEVIGVGTESIRIPITAAFPTHCLVIEPDEVDFGLSACGARHVRSVGITNACAGPVRLDDIRLDPTEFPAHSSCLNCRELTLSKEPDVGTVLQPGQGTDVEFVYLTRDWKVIEAELVVESTFGKQPATRSIALRAEGSLPRRQTTYRMPAAPKSDVLLVIDDGPSMAAKGTTLAANVDDIAGWFEPYPCWDANFAVLSTDTSDPATAGVFVGTSGSRFLNTLGSSGFFKDEAAARTVLPTDAKSSATPLEAIRLALSEPLVSTTNAGFLRMDASLEIVIVTDRAEKSPLPVADYSAFLDAIEWPRHAAVYSVAGFNDLTCGVEPDDGRLDAMGPAIDICKADWGFQKGSTGGDPCLEMKRSRFYLSYTSALPVHEALRVFINGAELPREGGASGEAWWWDETEHAVMLREPPPPGSTVVFDYATPCYP